MNKTNSLKKMIITLIILVLSILCVNNACYAASFSSSASKTSLNVGDTANFTITASECGGQFKISSSDDSVVSISSKASEWIENETKTYTITAKKAGTASITVTASDVSDTSGDHEVTGSKSVTITVTESKKEETPVTPTPQVQTKSSDTTIKLITVGGKTYTNPKTDITAPNVSADTSSIKISAQANDSKATITGTGTKELVTGTNKFTLKVTAENGATATYIIRITRLAEEKVTPNVVEEQVSEQEETQPLRLNLLTLIGAELTPEFNSEIFEYSANVVNIDEIKIDATSDDIEAKIEITGNTDLIEGENVIIVKIIKGEENVEYKIILNKTIENEEKEEDNIEYKDENKFSIIGIIQNWWNGPGRTEIVFISTLALLGASLIFAATAYKYNDKVKSTAKRAKNENEIN